MAFQARGSHTGGFTPGRPYKSSQHTETTNENSTGALAGNQLDQLVDQITEAVRTKLLTQGVPLPAAKNAAPAVAQKEVVGITPEWKRLLHHGADRIGNGGETPFQPHVLKDEESLAQKIDHTLLKPEATQEEIRRVCEEARKYQFATVCVNTTYIGLVSDLLKGSGVKPIAVVGFPLGAAATATKAFETREAVSLGAREIDMVINIGALRSKDYNLVIDDIAQVVEAAKPYPVKVILETSNLNLNEKIIGCALSKAAGAAFVKTSTGFASGGATAEDVALMREVVGPEMGVKASGGIRSYEDATKMIAAGATRVGASASVAIVTKAAGKSENKEVDTKTSSGKKPYKTSLY